ncbi:cache domain-containing protein [Geothrix sp. PMB-07]|uniref:cache domain-containing protein n=1 Tax=Geothrix sp. PMB-07 TaxID=3068640 RepID=UPI0027411E09|nr:cache domain-containing protein [Geothrix sp. PMB-07]WLT33557.1 cache domain-containing protein [Geothrix sp. PMB-07]
MRKNPLAAWFATQSVSLKLSSAFAAVLLLGVLGMGIYSSKRVRQQANQEELTTLALLSERLAGQVDTDLSTTRNLARHLALTQDAAAFLASRPRGARAEAFTTWLTRQAAQTPGTSAVFVLGRDGTCLASSQRAFVGRNFGFRPYFQEALSGNPCVSDWTIGAVTQTPRLFSAAPVHVGTRILGVLVTEYDVTELEHTIHTFAQPGCSVMLVNRQGIVLSHSDPSRTYHTIEPLPPPVRDELDRNRQFLGRSLPTDALSPEFPAAIHQTLEEGAPRLARYRLAKLTKWGAFSPIKGQPWVAVVATPEMDILGPTRAVWMDTLTVGLITSTAAFLLALGLVRLLLRPLRTLASAITAFGRGDSRSRAPIQTHRELDVLARTFNAMADTIQSHQENLEGLVHQRTRDLEQALADMKRLEGMIPICGYCKQIRDDSGSWWQLEQYMYIQDHTEAQFSHGICPQCRERHFPRKTPPTGS